MRILYKCEDGCVTLEQEPTTGIYVAHVLFNTWTVDKFKGYLIIWQRILAQLRSENIPYLIAIASDEKREKLMQMFGYSKIGETSGKAVMRIVL